MNKRKRGGVLQKCEKRVLEKKTNLVQERKGCIPGGKKTLQELKRDEVGSGGGRERERGGGRE